MRDVKRTSIAKYIEIRFIGVVFVMAVFMLFFITYFSDRSTRFDIRGQIREEGRSIYRELSYRDGKIFLAEDASDEEKGIYKIILEENGKYIGGVYPDKEILSYPIYVSEIRKIESFSGKYYIYDKYFVVRNKSDDTKRLVVGRTIVRKDTFTSQFKTFKYISYVYVIVILIAAVLISAVTSRHIIAPIKDIYKTADKIGKEQDLSQRMEYDGIFEEIEILSQANNRMLDRLEEMFETQKQFTSDVAHELRTPVSVILAECQYAKKHLSHKEEFLDAIALMERQVKKTNQIIMQLLSLSRMDQNRIKFESERVNLCEIIKAVCEGEKLKDKKNIEIQMQLEEVEADVDVNLIMIVLRNLINNALKYSRENSVVKISLCKELWKENQEEQVCIKIQDYGCGIKKEALGHIFDRFYREDKARNTEGFGLGLPISMKIVQLHHGKIQVESEVDKGSTFSLILPWKQKE